MPFYPKIPMCPKGDCPTAEILRGILDRHKCEDCYKLISLDTKTGEWVRRCWVCGKEITGKSKLT